MIKVQIYADICSLPESCPEEYKADVEYILNNARKEKCTFSMPEYLEVPFTVMLDTPLGIIELKIHRREVTLTPVDTSAFMIDGIVDLREYVKLGLAFVQNLQLDDIEAGDLQT